MRLVILVGIALLLSSCIIDTPPLRSDPTFVLPITSVTASGDDGNIPHNTLDSDLETRWSSQGAGEWITFELDGVFEVQEVHISWYRGDTRRASFEVSYSEDGETWARAYEGTSSGTTLEAETHDPTNAAARYVRIIGYGNDQNTWNSITTVTIRGKDRDANTRVLEYEQPPEPTPPTPPPTSNRDMSLRADPSFSRGDLSPRARERYDAFLVSLNDAYPSLVEQSTSPNMYNYGRGLYIGLSMISTVFRQTGDLELLDEIYELSKNTYDQLEDRWDPEGGASYYDTHLRKTLHAQDGYRNWRYRNYCGTGSSADTIYCGRDNHRLEEALSHGMAAGVMYALHVNRDLESPKGYDYGEMADAWLDYLRNDFEAKWRERYDHPWPEMPYFQRYFTHTNMAHLKTHYYVGRMLEDLGDPDAQVYLTEARKMTDQIFEEPHVPSGSHEQAGGFVTTQTPIGPAYIWAFGTPYNRGINSVSAAPSVYARYFLAMVAELHFDGAYRFEDPHVMEKLSRTVAYFILDTDPPYGSTTLMLAADVIGGDGDGAKTVEGMQGTAYRGRNNANRYAISTFGLYALWDETGRIEEVTEGAYVTASSRTRRLPLNAFRFISVYEEERQP